MPALQRRPEGSLPDLKLQQIQGLPGQLVGAVAEELDAAVGHPDVVDQGVVGPEVVQYARAEGWLLDVAVPGPAAGACAVFGHADQDRHHERADRAGAAQFDMSGVGRGALGVAAAAVYDFEFER